MIAVSLPPWFPPRAPTLFILGLRVVFISHRQLWPLDLVNDMAHHAPDLEVVIDGDGNAGVIGILRLQFKAPPVLHQALQSKFAIEGSDHDLAVGLLLGAIHDQQIPVIDPCTHH